MCVDSDMDSKDNDEPPMIALQFKTKFKHHENDESYVVLNCKKGDDGWDEEEQIENTWIDDEGGKSPERSVQKNNNFISNFIF